MNDKLNADDHLHAIEFAEFVLVLDDEDIPVVAYDERFPAHAELLERHSDCAEVRSARARLRAWLRLHAH